ncbi:FAD:protein FMN transferase [Ideonella azotifigens]|uniref:FAD:protein FMN transferase n=1 Tax=Ideonella azotifigens TaxID=513160 RepID=UPI001E5AA107|nr:FAD:protein FMN transferase [Ideonella azotifigens]MCD2344496.1 FAD:protein FMN transferase [Ideonella azotifigens]
MPSAAAPEQRRVLIPPTLQPAPLVLGQAVHRLAGRSMGTTWQVDWVGPRQVQPTAVQHALQIALDELVRQMSTWEADSELSRFCRLPEGAWQVLPPDFFLVMQAALQVAEASGGAFDPTVAPAVDHWGFGPTGRHDEAGFSAPAAALPVAPAWQALQLDSHQHAMRQPGGCRLDLSAIAKGHGVDVMARVLRERGIASFLVELGGELRGEGHKPDGQPWWVALEHPPGAELPSTVLALHGLSVATSGDYRRAYQAGGQVRSHTIDPRTGEPVAHGLASVSVLHADAMWADAWATALTVLGPQAGPACAQAQGLAALFISREADGRFSEHLSPALRAFLA